MRKSFYPLLLSSILACNCIYSQSRKINKNIEAIKHVIQKEVDALNKEHNLQDYLSCFANSEKTQAGPSNNKMTVGYQAIQSNAQTVIQNYNGKPNPNSWSFDHWDVRVNGKTAFASCVQTTTTPNGTFIDVYKSDYLEKIKGEWKIVDHRYFHAPERKQ